MTRFKRAVLEKLDQISSDMGFLKGAILQKDREVERLSDQNKDLMDRLMSIKFEDYINMNPDRWEGPLRKDIDESPETDENLAGRIITDEDLGKQSS